MSSMGQIIGQQKLRKGQQNDCKFYWAFSQMGVKHSVNIHFWKKIGMQGSKSFFAELKASWSRNISVNS